tara:strand:+ start:139 stop:567 length:429 start_codon:yes stop_codon:yes gene_type:complete
MSNSNGNLPQGEKVAIWIYRNLLASGVILVCGYFLWGEIRSIDSEHHIHLQSVENRLEDKIDNTTRTLLGIYHRDVRHDYGHAEPAYAGPLANMTENELASSALKKAEKYEEVSRQISDFTQQNDYLLREVAPPPVAMEDQK